MSLVSFIVPAWNEEAQFAATLTSIREAAPSLAEHFEIVVADGEAVRHKELAAPEHKPMD